MSHALHRTEEFWDTATGSIQQVCAEVQVLQILQRKQGRTYLADQSWITVGIIEIKHDDVVILATGEGPKRATRGGCMGANQNFFLNGRCPKITLQKSEIHN